MAENFEPLIERLINSRNRDLSLFLPMIVGLTNDTAAASPDQENPDSPTSRGRIIFVNPLTQGMFVIEGSSDSLDSLLRDLESKDGQPPASKESVEAMPIVEVRNGEEGECVICLEEWAADGLVKEMPCKHKFHGDCIEKWLNIHGSCPVCRYKMPADDDEDHSKRSGEERERRMRRRMRTRRGLWVRFSFSTERRSDESDQTTASESGSSDTLLSSVPPEPDSEN